MAKPKRLMLVGGHFNLILATCKIIQLIASYTQKQQLLLVISLTVQYFTDTPGLEQ